jgi:heterodisulfide reductase subunit C
MNGTSPTLVSELLENTGVNAATCYQCGKCSAGCPMANESDLRPHNIMRLVVQDRREKVLSDPTIWLCLSCETCSARCPNDSDPARVIDALREMSLESGAASAPRSIKAFHKAFLEQVRSNGRLHEVGLVMEYKLRSGHLMKDVTTAPSMFARGKLHLRPARIKGIAEVRRIFEKCEQRS